MTTIHDPNVHDRAGLLRAAMVSGLRDLDTFTSDEVQAAVATVPRHLFAPEASLEDAYHVDTALVIKRDSDGAALSSLSATHIQVVMLEQAAIEPGMQVLEIGSGGYNAALLAELVGGTGTVTSVDIDPDITTRARACLDNAGYQRVKVVLADADNGVPEHAPYDRIIVTAGAAEIPPAWLQQLAEHGRIVVPLRFRGLTRSIAFDCDGDQLVSDSYRLCGFVPMQGISAHTEPVMPVAEGVVLRLAQPSQQFDIEALHAALQAPRIEVWSGAAFDLPDELELFLMTSSPQMAILQGTPEVIAAGLLGPSVLRGAATLIDGGSFAYRIKRPDEQTGGFESGVYAHGPQAQTVAAQYIELLREWAGRHRRRGAASFRYVPRSALGTQTPPGQVVKRNGSFAVSWN